MLLNVEMLGLRFDIRNAYTNSLMKIYSAAKLCDLILNETFRNMILFNFEELNSRV